MNRRIATLVVALVPIVAFGVLMAMVTVPYISLGPGPTFDTLGEVDGREVVDIEGDAAMVFPTSGQLNMTTVSQRDGLTLGQALLLWLSGREQLVPRELIYPPERSREEIQEANTADFLASEADAAYAALNYLDYPVAVTVESVDDPGPSADRLAPGDAIDAVDGVPVSSLEEFQDYLATTRSGQEVVLDYRRGDDDTASTTVTLGDHPERAQGFLGVGVREAPWAPFSIEFNLANIGGPSAGLMFSLAVVDKLTTGELNDGRFVAGSGTITADGRVGGIGGITHKMYAARQAGATLFLVPADNCSEALTEPQDGLDLIRVEDLDGAVRALESLSAGGELPRC